MKTKTIENGNIKVWHDHEEEFIIVNKNERLVDTIIDANLLQRKYSKMLVEEVRNAGFDGLHGVFIDIDDSLETQLDKLEVSELDDIFNAFNSIFNTTYKYSMNSNGLLSIVFGEFRDYQDFKRKYFGTFLLKLFAFKIDIIGTEDKNDSIKGLSSFISKFAKDYLKVYLEISRERKFAGIIRIK